jgi:SpoIIAA-like
MPIELSQDNGKILIIHVTGKLVKADYAHFVPEFERFLRERGELRVLFDMRGLQGWDAGAAWEDFKFDVKHFTDIERLAMVGDKKWQHGMAMFFKPFTRAKTRYFDQAEGVAAREWLAEP